MRAPVTVGLLALAALAACKQTEENQAPTATATGPETVDAGTWVQLDGSESSDPEGADLNRRWSFVALPLASEAVLNDPTVENPSFRADVPGEYVVRLVVDDGFLRSAPSTVTVTANPVNGTPTAEAGLDRSVVTGNDVLLDGSASFDPDGDDLAYAWSFVEKPSGSIAAFDDPTSQTPGFTADLDGDYRVRLVVSDAEASSEPDLVVVNASADNLAPVAEAGVDQSVAVGTTVQLDGSSSYDPNGAALTWAWTFTDRPDGSTAALAQDGTATASFTADVEGTYDIALVVDDGLVASAPDTLRVQAFIENTPPVADAGDDGAGAVGDPIQLDGSGSSDADGDLLAFQWQFTGLPEGSTAVLNNPNVVSPTFTPDVETDPGVASDVYELRLQVWDGVFWSAADTVRFDAGVGNIPPVATITPEGDPDPVAVATGSTVQLDGSASSDDDGDALAYDWRITTAPEGFFGGLNAADIVNPSFVATVDGTYEVELRVWDGTAWSAPDTAAITASGGNLPPDAVITGDSDCGVDTSAGQDTCAVDAGTVITLDGQSSSDPNTGDGGLFDDPTLSWEWAFTARPSGSTATFNDPTLANPSFVPDVNGDYIVRLRVYDGHAWSGPASVTVSATGADQAPVADAGPHQMTASDDAWADCPDTEPADQGDDSVQTGTVVQLDGTGSTDPDGQALTYQWSFQSIATGSQSTLNNTAVASPSFTPDANGVYVARLQVYDGSLWSGPDFVCIEATGGNTAPEACAADDDDDPATGCLPALPAVFDGDTVHLDSSSAFDAEGDPLAWTWEFTALPAGSDAVLNDRHVANPSFVADELGTYGLRARVSDGDLVSPWSYVTVEAN